MPPNWINGIKPPGLEAAKLLVIGPEDFDDEAHVHIMLDDCTLKMEAVEVIILTEGNIGKHRGKGFKYEGVSAFAGEWAVRRFWPLHTHNHGWWGKSVVKAKRARDNAVFELLGASGHCLALWNGEGGETAELMERARDQIPMSHFHYRRI